MPKNPIPFPTPKTPDPPLPGATQGSQVILGIGSQRYAFDFYSKMTLLSPEPGVVVPMDSSKNRKKPSAEKKPVVAKKRKRGI